MSLIKQHSLQKEETQNCDHKVFLKWSVGLCFSSSWTTIVGLTVQQSTTLFTAQQ